MKNPINTICLFTCIVLVSSCLKKNDYNREKEIYRPFKISQFDTLFYQKDFSIAWDNRDSLVFKIAIDSLSTLTPEKAIYTAYNLSEITGFGWAFVNIDDLTWLDTMKIEQKIVVIENIKQGFEIYKESPIFMKRLNSTLLMHEFFNNQSNQAIPLDNNVKLYVKRFLENLNNNAFIVLDNKEEINAILKKIDPKK